MQESVNADLIASMRSGMATGLTGMPQRPKHENDSIPKIAPKWLKHDRQVSLTPSLTTVGAIDARDLIYYTLWLALP